MYRKVICVLLACGVVYLSACTAYQPQIAEPEGEADKSAWLLYYRQQFSVYGDSTLPPKQDAPDVARQAYMEAHRERNQRQGMIMAVALVGGLAIGAVIASRTYDDTPRGH